jgi:hypothetical protein
MMIGVDIGIHVYNIAKLIIDMKIFYGIGTLFFSTVMFLQSEINSVVVISSLLFLYFLWQFTFVK